VSATEESPHQVGDTPLYRIAAACYVAQIGLLFAWLIWLSPPPPESRSLMLVIFLLPLLLGLRGLLHRRRYTLQWTGMLILAYFVHGMLAATGGFPERWLGSAELVLTLGYFGAAMLILRRGKKRHKAEKQSLGAD
jgi:uncharacterized membrane protein